MTVKGSLNGKYISEGKKFRKTFSTFLPLTNTFKNSNNLYNFKQFKIIIVCSVKCAVRLVGYLLNVNG